MDLVPRLVAGQNCWTRPQTRVGHVRLERAGWRWHGNTAAVYPIGRKQRARTHHQCHRRRAHHRGTGPAGRPRPAGHVHLADDRGIVAALVGSLIASALGVGATRGIDWIKLIIQVALAAAGWRWSPAGTHRVEGASKAGARGSVVVHGRIAFRASSAPPRTS